MITVEVQGLDEAMKAFRKLGEVGELYAQKALDETAIEGVSAARLATPVVTNRLRSSIHFENRQTTSFAYKDKRGRGYSGVFSQRPKRNEVLVGTNVEYAEGVNYRRRFMEAGLKQMRYIIDHRFNVNYTKAINEIIGR